MKKSVFIMSLVAAVMFTSCASKKDLEACRQENKSLQANYTDTKEKLAAATTRAASLEEQLKQQEKAYKALQRSLDKSLTNASQNNVSIEKLVDQINESNKYIRHLVEVKSKSDSLNMVLTNNLTRSLSKEELKEVDVQVLKGVVYISLADNMLYKSGSYEINDRAAATLSKIAKIIKDYKDYDVLIEGNTDNVPISRENIRNNWDLSCLRASSVVQALQNNYGVDPKRLTAGGRGEYNPLQSNTTEAGKQRNRRTQIIITPKLDEFMELAHLVGFEPQICFNMMTSEPFKAKQMVEYLNAPADVGMGEYRALNGHPEPYHVRLFEMDNEPDRKWSAEQYAEQCVLFARKMREADPEIEFMMAAYCFDPGLLRRMLEIAGQDVQYVIYRQGDPDFVRKILPILREYNQTHGTDVRLVDTEWLSPMSTPEPYEDPEMAMEFSWYGQIRNDVKNNFSSRQVGWNYALNGAHRLLDYISYGGEFALANFNNMCNTWGQNVVECTKDSAFLSCMGQVFRFFGKKFEPCVAELCETGDRNVFAVRTRTQSGKNQLYVVNHLSRPVSLTLPEGDWNAAEGLSAPHRISQEKEHQREVREIAVPCEDGIAELPGLSVVCFSEG